MEELYQSYARTVYKFLLAKCGDPDLAEELTQETFFQAVQSIGRFDGSCKVSTWLCQIAKHLWYQHLAKHSRQKQVELTAEIPGGDSLEADIIRRMDKIALYQAIHLLPESMREVVHMRLTGEFSFREIGEILGKNENWARTAFYRAKQKIMEYMEGPK